MQKDSRTSIVIIADDQIESRLIAEHVLKDEFEVRCFADGSEVLDYLSQGGKADLYLLDVVMPNIDGFELCRRLKETPETSLADRKSVV